MSAQIQDQTNINFALTNLTMMHSHLILLSEIVVDQLITETAAKCLSHKIAIESLLGFLMNSKFDTILLVIYVSGFEKRYNFAQMGDIEIVHCFESTVNELHVALNFVSLAATIAEICSFREQNYTRCTFAQFACFYL